MDKNELLARLRKPEWRDLECKKSQHGVSDDACRTVSAFANTYGGHMVFGVKDVHGRCIHCYGSARTRAERGA